MRAGDSVGLGFRPVHEGFYPSCTVYEFCGGYNILHPAVFHLREETKSGYFCVRHSAEEEHQRRPVLPLLACRAGKGDARHSNKKEKLNEINKYIPCLRKQRTFHVFPVKQMVCYTEVTHRETVRKGQQLSKTTWQMTE